MTVVSILALAILAASSCDSPAAQRERARAETVRVEAVAYQMRAEADAKADAERAATRQMERDAAHQRALETLPYLMLICGGVGVGGLVVLAFWDLRRVADPRLLFYLDRLQLDQAERDRQLWRAIAALDRRALTGGDNEGGIVSWQERR